MHYIQVQQRINDTADKKANRIQWPLIPSEMNLLIENLKVLDHDSLWGAAIVKAVKDDKILELIPGLAQQAYDDFFTMMQVVGWNNTELLLRSLITNK